MANTPDVLSIDPVDEVPKGRVTKPSKYQHIVDQVIEESEPLKVTCADRQSAEAVYVGIKRIIKKTGAKVRVSTHATPDNRVAVYVEPDQRKTA